jgi:hypothetical protein
LHQFGVHDANSPGLLLDRIGQLMPGPRTQVRIIQLVQQVVDRRQRTPLAELDLRDALKVLAA